MYLKLRYTVFHICHIVILAYLFAYLLIDLFTYFLSNFRNKSTNYMKKMYVSRLICQVNNFVLTMHFENLFFDFCRPTGL